MRDEALADEGDLMLEVIDKGSVTESHPAALLFVHGACGNASVWDEHFLDFYANKGYRAVALSLRGHGASSLSKPLNSCSIADYVDDVHAVVTELGCSTVLIGHSLGCWVALTYLARQDAPAGVLIAPGTPKGMRQWVFQSILRHPLRVLRSNISGKPDLFNTPALARKFFFTARTPEAIVISTAARLEPESRRVGLEIMKPLPQAGLISAPMLVLGAKEDGSRIDGDVSTVAEIYQADVEIFPDFGHIMMLEPAWQAVAERIDTWLATKGL
jgi:pimeloyl-ACP methyl ester carboxylesterase